MRAFVLVAGLILSGPAWGQTGTICVRDGVTWNSLGGRCDEERAAGMGAPSGNTTLEYIRPAIPACACSEGQICQPRRYTPAEIDRMRVAVRKRLTVTREGTFYGRPGEPSQAVDVIEAPSIDTIEQTLRTYIAAGITAEELEKQ